MNIVDIYCLTEATTRTIRDPKVAKWDRKLKPFLTSASAQ